jgi:hypothetical protein
MQSTTAIISALRRAAPASEPIGPFERRVVVTVVLISLIVIWALIWTAHHMDGAQHEQRVFGSRNIRVTLERDGPEPPARPARRSSASKVATWNRRG